MLNNNDVCFSMGVYEVHVGICIITMVGLCYDDADIFVICHLQVQGNKCSMKIKVRRAIPYSYNRIAGWYFF